MASSTLLQIVQTVQAELGLFPAAATVQAATDDTVMQMLALLNRVGDDVAQRKNAWTVLDTAATVSVVAGVDTYALPADFRAFINRSEWDSTNHWELIGPVSPQEWQFLTNGIVMSGPRRRFRAIGRTSQIQIFPVPGSTDSPASLSYLYRTKYWASTASGVPQAKFLMDSDTCVFPDPVMITGLKFRWMKDKGFDVSVHGQDHEIAVRIAIAQDGGAKTLSILPRKGSMLLSSGNVRDANFGV